MNANFQRRIQRYGWDKAAATYEQGWQSQLLPAQVQLIETANLRPGEFVLDIACGTGLVTFPAADRVGRHGMVTGTDISRKMIDICRKSTHINAYENVCFEQMDGEKLRFPDDSYDAVICALGMMYFPDPLQSLREMHRTLKKGGRAVAAVWGQRSNCGWADIFPIVDAKVDSDVCPLFFALGTGEALAEEYRKAGFGNISSCRLQTRLHYQTPEAAMSAIFEGGPVALAYSRFDDQTRQQVQDEYLASIAPFQHNDGYHIPGEFVVVSGQKP